jgi:hypothetical protein
MICPVCGRPAIDTHQETADVGVGTIHGPTWYICEMQHGWSPEQELMDKMFKEAQA